MNQLVKAQARSSIDIVDAAELARLAGTQGRETFAREDLEDQLGSGPLILDGLRRRPHYFDGRFLTGADLTRDQDYVRQRQADMARSAGSGVISGLQVRSMALARGQTVRIQPGVGLTPSGDLVMLTQQRDVPLLDLPLSRQLDAAMGLREEPRVPLGRRTGLFILALRSVEFTANPIAAYPRSISGQRTVEDGDIIEATAITLIPYPETSGAANLTEARRAVARQVFAGKPNGLPQDALPLAMLAVDHGSVRWIDTAMVRRETGADSGVQVAFGGRPRSLSEAHVLQHRAHLTDVLTEMMGRSMLPIFAASQYFSVLPPAGQLPAAAIRPDDFGFSQLYFPPTVDVDLAFVPLDEIGVLVEESLALPPIDLQAQAADLDATGVLILVPVTRQRFQRFDNALPATTTPVATDAASAGAKPAFDMLATLVAKRRKAIEASERDADAKAQAEAEALKVKTWHAAFQEAVSALPSEGGRPPLLWYTRRRSIAYQTRVAGVGIAVSGDDVVISATVNANLARLKLEKRVAALNGKATPQATARFIALLGSRSVSRSDVLTVSVISDVEKSIKTKATPPVEMMTMKPLSSINPTVLGNLQPASIALAGSRADLGKTVASTGFVNPELLPKIDEINLTEGQVMDVAQKYSGPRLGEGFARLDSTLGVEWPDAKSAIWLGESGKSLDVDTAFRAAPGEKLADFADLLSKAVAAQDADAVGKVVEKMR
jgi:hypothetical protein